MVKADAARDRRDPGVAANYYKEVIDRWGSNYPILMQLGNALKDSGSFADAERVYLEAIAIRPEEADSFVQFGHLMKLKGNIEQAERFYQDAYSLNPMRVDVLNELKMIDANRPALIAERRYLDIRWDMSLPASVVYFRLTNQYRWRRG